jgi:hypothetical protein
MNDAWGRVAGFAVLEDGAMAAVWIAYEQPTDTAHIFDAAVFDVPLDRVAEGLNARGRQIAIAWAKSSKSVADRLYSLGCNMVRDAVDDDALAAAVQTKELVRRLTGSRLVADPRIKEWTREYETWQRSGAAVPESPLLVATRYALERLDYASPRQTSRSGPTYPKIAIR